MRYLKEQVQQQVQALIIQHIHENNSPSEFEIGTGFQ